MNYRYRTYAVAAVISAAVSLVPATANAADHDTSGSATGRVIPAGGLDAFTFNRRAEAGPVLSEFLKI